MANPYLYVYIKHGQVLGQNVDTMDMNKQIILGLTLLLSLGCSRQESAMHQNIPLEENDHDIVLDIIAQKAIRRAEHQTFHEIVDQAREFVNYNSYHSQTPSPYHPNNVTKYAEDILKVLENGGSLPILYCGHRARLLMHILLRAGYQTRLVNMLTYNEGHQLMEVLNPETELWEIADADFNIYYSDGSKRLNLKDLVTMSMNSFKPCRNNICTWELPESNGWFTVQLLIDSQLYNAGLIHRGSVALPVQDHITVLYNNPNRIDIFQPTARFEGLSLFQKFAEHNGVVQTIVGPTF